MSVRDDQPSDRSSIRGATGYQPPTWQERRRIRGSGSGHHGIVRFLAFALLLASIVLVALVTIGRPILASTVVGWASDNPSAYTMPFVSTLVEEDLGSKLTTAASDDASEVDFAVQSGDSTQDIARRLESDHLLLDSRAFVYLAYKNKVASTWTAGDYTLRANMTPQELLSTIQAGPPPDPTITIGLREGLRLEQITALLEKLNTEQGLQLNPMDFYNEVKHPPADLLAQYPWLHLPKGASLEGFLAPATYRVKPDVTAEDLTKMLLDHFYETVGTDRMNVPKARGLSFYQVVTLASIVEQETVQDDERPVIAGVYQNRLNKKMILGADPTVIYGNDTVQLDELPFEQWVQFSFWNIPKAPSMSSVDLPADLAGYQTYQRQGLIPGPICTPTVASIDAALDPDTSKGYLYFVAIRDASGKSTGRHAFAKTEAEHIANLKKYGYIK
jgi:peptidoglycan lytic transglycosylase G